jgi:RNA polymerase sigma factor (sigma-70 family)
VSNRFNDFKEGSEKAFRRYFDLYARALCAFVFGYCKSLMEAQDIAQECFLVLFKNREKLNDEQHLKHYLFVVARHMALDHKMAEGRRKKWEHDWAEARPGWVQQEDEAEMMTALVLSKVHELSKKMPPRQREVFELYFYKEMDVRSIASFRRLSESTVYNQLRQAYSFLVKEMPDPELLIWLAVLFYRSRR